MPDIGRRLAVFAVVAAGVGYAVLFAVDQATSAFAEESNKPIEVRDVIGRNTHELSGILMLRSSCDLLDVDVIQVTRTIFHIAFNTWRTPYTDCTQNDVVPRQFKTTVFAPSAGITFQASLDEVPIEITVYQVKK